MRQSFVLIACALACAGCQTAGEQGAEPAAPANYRHLVAAHVKSTFHDPYSIRDAEISVTPPKKLMGPSLNSDGFTTPWAVCIRANAKNRLGAYTGRSVTAVGISRTEAVNSWDEDHGSGMLCRDAVYQPFPEIEAGGKPR